MFVEQINTTLGIGYLANDARDFMGTDVIVICLLIYSVLGLLIDGVMTWAVNSSLRGRN